jgi:outer membrane receptor for ferrienterochelin and colicins
LHKLENSAELMARVYFDDYRYKGDYLYSGANPGDPTILMKDSSYGQWVGGELMYTQRLFEKHMLTIGAEDRYNLHQNQENYDESPYLGRLDDRRSSNLYAFYLQDEYYILSNLIFNAGLRYDYYDTFGETINPRVALIYKPLEKNIFKLLYGSAFRAPNAYELYYQDNGISAKSNLDLKPEKIKTYEIVYEHYMGENFRSSLSGFYYQIDDLISQQTDTDGLMIFKNSGRADGKGLEFELEGKWANGVQGRVSYVLQEVKDHDTGELLTNSPRHLAKLNLNVPLIKNMLYAGAELQCTSSRKTLAGETNGFATTNLTLFSQNFIKGLDIAFSFYNLLDQRYGDPGAGEHRQDVIEQDGRNFRFKLTYRF